MKSIYLRPAIVSAVVLTTILSGCSESATGTTTSTSQSASAAAIDAAIGTQFSGGKAGKADGAATPIKIGMINQEGGQVSDPEGSVAVKAAFDYINAELGGIGGHPLQVDLCKVTSSEEEAQQCAQRFLNDKDISVILQGGLNVGTNSVNDTLGGAKPDVIIQANPGSDTTAKNAFAVNPSVMAALPGMANFAGKQGYKSVGVVVDDNPGDLAIAQIAQKSFEALGMKAKVTTFPAGSTDLTSAFTAALADKPDVISPVIVTTAGCIATAKALATIGSSTPVLNSALCATQDMKDALGDFPKWSYEGQVQLLFAPDSSGQLDFYKAVMAKYAGADAQLGINAPASFGAAFLLAKVLNQVGADKITPDAVSQGLKSYSDGVLLGTPKVKFGSVTDMPTLSGMTDHFSTYEGDGKWTISDWQNVPE